jgi:cytochrome c oxidase assembly protein subunit 11
MAVTPDTAKNRRVAWIAAAVAVGMVGLSFASVPLYRLFCQSTGFAGTTQRAAAAPGATGQTITVSFDANISEKLKWNFHPQQASITVPLGAQTMAHYIATNVSDQTLTGSAIFNVTPESAGAYFNKIQCFCFTEQTLKPGETVDMPVVFFVDPAIAADLDTQSIKTITLSYTFYPVDKPKSVSQAAAPAQPKAN